MTSTICAFHLGFGLVPFPLEYALYQIPISPVRRSRASWNPQLEVTFQYRQDYLEPALVLTIIALVFGFSGLIVAVTSMATRFDPVPRGRLDLAVFALLGAMMLSGGSALVTLTAVSAPPNWLIWPEVLPWLGSIFLIFVGLGIFGCMWYRATKP